MIVPDEIPTAIAGVTHDNPDGTNRQKVLLWCKLNGIKQLVLEREPDNPYDANAVKVLAVVSNGNVVKRLQLGYIRNRRYVCKGCGLVREPEPGEKLDGCFNCGVNDFERDGLASRIASAMDTGVEYDVEVLEYTGGVDGKNIGCNISIRTKETAEALR